MTEGEWIKENFVKSDIDYLKKCGFVIEIVKNEDTRYNSEYFIYVSDGKNTEILSSPYHLEQAVNIIKMYQRLKRPNKK